MKVFYASPWRGKSKHQKTYNKIIETLKSHPEVEIISLEVLEYKDVLPAKKLTELSGDELHAEYIRAAISLSDAAIIEASYDNFKIGYEASKVLDANKPLLCISSTTNYSKYIQHPLFYSEIISDLKDIDTVVNKFIKEVSNKHLTIRLNSLISPEHKNFLEWLSSKTNKSKANIIRELIDQEMKRHKNYSKEVYRQRK